MSYILGFPSGSDGKESACNAGDLGLIPGSGRAPGEGNGNPLQYYRGAWQATVHGVSKSQMTEHARNQWKQSPADRAVSLKL